MPVHLRFHCLLICFMLFAMGGSHAAEEPAVRSDQAVPLVSVFVRSLNRLADDMQHLRELSGAQDPHPAQQRLDFIRRMEGIDAEGRLGLFLFWNDAHPRRPDFLLSIPLRDALLFQKSLMALKQLQIEEIGPTRWRVRTEKQQFFIDSADTRAWLAASEPVLGRRDRVAEALSDQHADVDLVFCLMADGIPRPVREAISNRCESEIERKLSKVEASEAKDKQLRSDLLKLIRSAILTGLHGTEKFEVRWDLNDRVVASLRWTAHSNSELSNSLRALSLSRAERVQRQARRSPLTLECALQLPEQIRNVLAHLLEQVRSKVTQQIGSKLPEQEQAAAAGVFDSLNATLTSGHLSGSMRFVSAAQGFQSFLFCAALEQPEGLAQTLRTVLPYVAYSEQVKSVELHSITTSTLDVHCIDPAKLSKQDIRLYGPSARYFVGTSPQGLVYAQGGESTEDLLRQIEFTEQPSPPLLEVQCCFRPWIDLGLRAKPDAQVLMRLDGLFPSGTTNDQLSAKLEAKADGLELNISAEADYLRLLAQFIPKGRSAVKSAQPLSHREHRNIAHQRSLDLMHAVNAIHDGRANNCARQMIFGEPGKSVPGHLASTSHVDLAPAGTGICD